MIGQLGPYALRFPIPETNNGDPLVIRRSVELLIDESIHRVHKAAHLLGHFFIRVFNPWSQPTSKHRNDRHKLILS